MYFDSVGERIQWHTIDKFSGISTLIRSVMVYNTKGDLDHVVWNKLREKERIRENVERERSLKSHSIEFCYVCPFLAWLQSAYLYWLFTWRYRSHDLLQIFVLNILFWRLRQTYLWSVVTKTLLASADCLDLYSTYSQLVVHQVLGYAPAVRDVWSW